MPNYQQVSFTISRGQIKLFCRDILLFSIKESFLPKTHFALNRYARTQRSDEKNLSHHVIQLSFKSKLSYFQHIRVNGRVFHQIR